MKTWLAAVFVVSLQDASKLVSVAESKQTSKDEVVIRGRAIRTETGERVPNAYLLLRTGDDSVDFPQTWKALGGKEGILDLMVRGQAIRRMHELGGWKPARTTYSKEDGSFEFCVPRGTLRFVIDAEAPGLISTPDQPSFVDAPEAVRGFVVILRPAPSVVGRITDDDGKPVPNASITNRQFTRWGMTFAEALPLPRRTDADGRFEFPAIATYGNESTSLYVVQEHYVPSDIKVPNISGKIQRFDVCLDKGYVVTGRAMYESRPAKNVVMKLVREPGHLDLWWLMDACSDANGVVRWNSIARGRYAVQVFEEREWKTLAGVTIEVPQPDQDARPVWTVSPAATRPALPRETTTPTSQPTSKLIIFVRDKLTQQPITDFEYVMFPTDGSISGGPLPDTYDVIHTDDGKLEDEGSPHVRGSAFGDTPEHWWFVHIRTGRHREFRGSIIVDSGATKTENIDLEHVCNVRGKVIDGPTSRPRGGIEIRWHRVPDIPSGRGPYDTITQQDGTFELGGLGGRIQISAYTPGGPEVYSAVIGLVPGELRDIGTLILSK